MIKETCKNNVLEKEKEKFNQYLLDMDYSKSTRKKYKLVINRLERYMFKFNLKQYSRGVGEVFLKDLTIQEEYTSSTIIESGYMMRRFDCFMEQGEYALVQSKINRETPAQFMEVFEKYIDNLARIGQRENTIKRKYSTIQRALIDFSKAGVQYYSDISPEFIYEIFKKSNDKRGFCGSIRDFLRFLFKNGYVEFDYSEIVPSVRKPQCVPSVYTKDEIKDFLNVVDTNSASGKRNMAIILLALRLGMRSSDIANLKIEDIDLVNKTINFIQIKTMIPQRLELLPEIEKALFLYMTIRPASDSKNIFLTMKAPFRPITRGIIGICISRYMKKAGINIGDRKHGSHALRMTLASELASEKIPYDAIRKILGHEDPNVIKHYVKFDIDALRSCSIEIPPVTGKLAAYMQVRLGGVSQ